MKIKINLCHLYLLFFGVVPFIGYSQTDNETIIKINKSKWSMRKDLAAHFFHLEYSSSTKKENDCFAAYNAAQELHNNGKYIESLSICNQLLSRKDEIYKNRDLRWMINNLLDYKAQNQLLLDNFRGADSTITELLCTNNHFNPWSRPHSFLFRTMVENQTIEPRYTFGINFPNTLPFFTNIRKNIINEDFDYSKSLSQNRKKTALELGFFIYRNFKNFCFGIEPTWNNIALQRAIVHTSGLYKSELQEDSRFFRLKLSSLHDSYLSWPKIGHTPSKLSLGPSLTFIKLRSSFGSITSNLPEYSSNESNSLLITIPSNAAKTTYVNLMTSRTKYNCAAGFDVRFRFYIPGGAGECSLLISYQYVLREYTNKKISAEYDTLFNNYYVDSPTKMSYLQIGFCLGLRSKKGFKISSSMRYE